MRLQRSSTKLAHARPVVAPRAAMVLLASAVLALTGCTTTTGGVKGVVVSPLSAAHYAPSQTVDVLSAMPAQPHEALAELALSDPTATASTSQLTAQLVEAARQLGADALVVEQVSRPAAGGVAFDPAGGKMQDTRANGALSITAQAIRYIH